MGPASSDLRMTRTLASLALSSLRGHRALLARFASTALGRTATSVAVVLLIREFLEGVLESRGGLASSIAGTFGPSGALWAVAVLLLAVSLLGALLSYDNEVVSQRLVRQVELSIMERVIRHLLRLPVGFFDRQRQGDVLEAVRQDITRVRLAMMAVVDVGVESVQTAAYLGTAVWLSPRLALTALPVLLLAVGPVWWVAGEMRKRSRRARRFGFVLSDLLLQVLRGIRIVKVYAGEEAETANTIRTARRYFAELVATARARALSVVALETLGGLSVVIVIVLGGFQVLSGSLEVPSLVAFLVAVRAMHGPMNKAQSHFLEIHRHSASVARLADILRTEPDLRDAPGALPLREAPRYIAFDAVSFAYPAGTPILDQVSFDVRGGEQIGIVGPSGVGKTTLVSLVARFYDPTAGRVLWDGRDLRDYRLADVYRQVAIVTQEPFVFGTSIRDNIRYGRPSASDADVERAATAAEIHGDILAMPEGYDTVVGVGGRALSMGQLQRLNVARALLKDAPLLILDEATASLDSISEAKVQAAINRLKEGRTTFIVAHRLSTLRHANRILVLDGGRCVGLGSHEELLTACGPYRRLWKAQEVAHA